MGGVRRVIVAVAVGGVLAGCGGGPDPAARPSTTSSTDHETPATTARPPYASTVAPVTAERLGPTYQAGCPVGPEDLRLLSVSYLGFDGKPATGELVVAAAISDAVVDAFRELYQAEFPIRKMITIEEYGGDDDASMAEDNTSAFNCRAVTGGAGWSAHSYGVAIDINPRENPYVRGDVVLPPDGAGYLDRADVRLGMIIDGGRARVHVARVRVGWRLDDAQGLPARRDAMTTLSRAPGRMGRCAASRWTCVGRV